MYPGDLQTYLKLLEQAGQLACVPVEVDPCLELATVVNQVNTLPDGGPALCFQQVKGTALPVATNLLATKQRVGWAIGSDDLTALTARFASDLQGFADNNPVQALRRLLNDQRWQPVIVEQPLWRRGGAISTLADLPQIKAWPGDGGAYLTMAQIYTRHPESGELNCGMYRVQLHGAMTATIRFRQGSDGAQHLAAWHARGAPMPVALALGGPPTLSWAAGVPLPAGVWEAAFCGYLGEQALTMSRCSTSDLLVPSSAEIVIEGEIAPGAVRAEGPFGNHTGGYDAVMACPEMRVLEVSARDEAIFPWTLVGPPPRENIGMAQVTAELLLPLVTLAVPSVRQLHMPAEGIFHRVALVSLDPAETRPLREVARELWETCLLKGARLLVVGVADHDPHDVSAVFWRVLNRVDWSRDLLVEDGRLAVDARRLPETGTVQCDPRVLAKVLGNWGAYQL